MSQEYNKYKPTDYVEDPELPLAEVESRLDPEQLKTARRSRQLDADLKRAFAELRAGADRPLDGAAFDRRLREAIREPDRGEVVYLSEVRRREAKDRLREAFVYSEFRFVRYGVAAVLVAALLSPVWMRYIGGAGGEDQQATGGELALKSAPVLPGAAQSEGELAGDVLAPPEYSQNQDRRLEQPGVDAAEVQIQILEEKLGRARTDSEKLTLLRQLEGLYERAGDSAKLAAVRESIRKIDR
jgi:hypothetical protein